MSSGYIRVREFDRRGGGKRIDRECVRIASDSRYGKLTIYIVT